MKKYVLMMMVCLWISAGWAQIDADKEKALREKAAKATTDTAQHFGWAHSVVAGLTLTQVAFKDWAPGGENALAYALGLAGESADNERMTSWSNVYKLAYGQTKLGDQGIRKTNDEIYFESMFIEKLWLQVNPYVAAMLRTQFAPGFNYDIDGKGTDVQVSKFFDPAYLTESAGAAYKPVPEISTRLGIGLREVVTNTYTQYADDPATLEVEKVRVQGGMESVTDVNWNFAENMKFTANLALFAPFKTMDQIIVRSDNTVSAKVNSYISVSFNVQLINDRTVSARTQIKQILALGFSYQLL
jgi:hypothetical protein